MNYRVKITYWKGLLEETVSMTETIYATDCAEALHLILDKYGFTDEDIEDVDVEAVIE